MANYLGRGKFVPDFFNILNYNWGKEHHSFNRHFGVYYFRVSLKYIALQFKIKFTDTLFLY